MATATANSKKLEAADEPGRCGNVEGQFQQPAGSIGKEEDKEVCKVRGMAMRTMWSGFDKMTWAGLKMMTSVSNSPHVVAESNCVQSAVQNNRDLFVLMTVIRVRIPPARGMTTNEC